MNAEDAVRQMEEPELLTEVPPILKRLAKTVAYAFYDPELIVTISCLTNYPCIDEDALLEKLQFDKRQLRGILSRLKNDKLVKQRQIKEKQPDTANFNVYNFYFINYKLFVNVVKYKLDHIRRKLETEEQQARNRPSFQCLQCHKNFSDLEVDRLMDFATGMLKCSFCHGEVEEDANHINTQTKGSSLGRFNEQMENIYNLLRECENINLAPEILEPTPSTASIKVSHKSSSNSGTKSGWASANNKVQDLYDQNIQINVGDEVDSNNEPKKKKDLPKWMSESTVFNNDESNDSFSSHTSSTMQRSETPNILTTPSNTVENKQEIPVNSVTTGVVEEEEQDFMTHLLAHENSSKKPRLEADLNIVKPEEHFEKTLTSDSKEKFTEVTDSVDSDEEDDDGEENVTVKVGDKHYQLDELTDEIIEKMTLAEHENYLKVYNEAYEHFY